MSKFHTIFLIIFSFFGYSQEFTSNSDSYYFEVKDLNFLPRITLVNDNIKLNVEDIELQNIFSKYSIKDFHLAFLGTKRELLLRTYIINCDIGLINELKEKYSHIYNLVEVPEVYPLFIPNDLGINGINGQPELTFVGAESAWDISKGDNVTIGIAENVNYYQEDLTGKCISVNGYNPTPSSVGHGTMVALVAGASTNNGIGMASIGFNVDIQSASGYSGLLQLAQSGSKVINMSWGSCQTNPVIYENEIINEVWEDYNVVLVAAAGNGQWSCPTGAQYNHFPASFKNVISVTNVGHQYDIGTSGVDENYWKDVFLRTTPPFYATYNVNVDLSAPGRNILSVSSNNPNTYSYDGGTSFSAPMVTGTIGLMFSVNNCLLPIEVESILKLTAVKNDTLVNNLLYEGQIGAGRLDAFKAVDMSNQMSLEYGIVNVKNRIIDRWDFVLKNNPFNIVLENNKVIDEATLDFIAKNSIEILSGDYFPSLSGFVDLKVDSAIVLCEESSGRNSSFEKNKKNDEVLSKNILLFPNPNNGNFRISLNDTSINEASIEIYDIYGKLIFSDKSRNQDIDVALPAIANGVYMVKVKTNSRVSNLKFIKN